MTRTGFLAPLLLAMVTAVAVAAAACGGGAAPAPTQAPAKPAAAPTAAPAKPAAEPTKASGAAATGAPALTKEYKISVVTGGTAGTYYPFGGALAGIWSKNLKGVTVNVETSGASVENMRLLGSKQVELAITQNDIAEYAYTGTEMFQEKKEKITNFRAVAAFYPELIQWMVVPGIKTPQDLKGKRFVVGPPASGSEANTRQIFDALGMSYKDLGKAAYLSIAESAAAFKDRQIDGFSTTGGVPNPGMTDVTTTMEAGFVGMDADVVKKVTDRYKFYVPAKIPAGAYKGLAADVPTVAVQSMLVAREDLDPDLVYWLTRTLVEKQPDLAQAHAKGKEFSKEGAVKGLTVPLHPGAEKYYKEIGVLK